MINNIQEQAYFQTFGNFTKNSRPVYPFAMRSSASFDSFEKTNNQQSQQPSFKGKWLTKENIIIGATGLALVGTAITVGIISKRNMNKTLKSVQGALVDSQKAFSDVQEKLETQTQQYIENQKLIAELRKKLSSMSDLPDDLKEAKNVLLKQYQSLLQDTKLSYDPLKPPANVEMPDNIALRYARKIYNFEDLTGFTEKNISGDILDTAELKKIFAQKGAIDISLPMSNEMNVVHSPNTSIAGLNIPNLGKETEINITLNYGKNVEWSEEKIARDIMQNFYDGHGNTLDGVKVAIKSLPDGQYKVKVSGLATFDYKDLKYMGSGSKIENPYNAGGFGEGSKVLAAAMLGDGHAQNIIYACDDWKLTFGKMQNIMSNTLEQVQNPIQGNYVEFQTGNKKLVDAMLDSINYFKHSQNPDFKGLHFDSKDFGFKFMENPDAKGNIYLTQRFEFEKTGNWDNCLDNIRLIFKRKPDPKKFKDITGVALGRDRDRQFLTFNDIKNYTRYFAHEMSDEDLLKALITTKTQWANLPIGHKNSSLKSFIEGLIDEMYQRNLAINYDNSKFLALSSRPSDAVRDIIDHYGYKPCPGIFENTGMLNADEVFKKYSIHKPITPTVDEIKKFKLLEEGIHVVKEDIIDVAKRIHAQKPIFHFRSDISEKDFAEFIHSLNDFPEIIDIVEKYDPKKLSNESFEACKKEVENFVIEKLKTAAFDDLTYKKYLKLKNIDKTSGILDVSTNEYLKTLSNFDLITVDDIKKPRYIFDRNNELATNTLGEAIIDKSSGTNIYKGHWVDKEYLDNADFISLLTTWLHEICHKSGGDGTSEFTYTLTDMLQVLLSPTNTKNRNLKLAALEELFNQVQKPIAQAV